MYSRSGQYKKLSHLAEILVRLPENQSYRLTGPLWLNNFGMKITDNLHASTKYQPLKSYFLTEYLVFSIMMCEEIKRKNQDITR